MSVVDAPLAVGVAFEFADGGISALTTARDALADAHDEAADEGRLQPAAGRLAEATADLVDAVLAADGRVSAEKLHAFFELVDASEVVELRAGVERIDRARLALGRVCRRYVRIEKELVNELRPIEEQRRRDAEAPLAADDRLRNLRLRVAAEQIDALRVRFRAARARLAADAREPLAEFRAGLTDVCHVLTRLIDM